MRRLILFLLVATACRAQGTFTAATCNYADVNGLINNTGGSQQHLAVNGDIINIPAGSCTWASGLSVNVSITIKGAGTPNTLPSQFGSGTLTTIITDNVPGNAALISAQVSFVSGALIRISSLDIEPTAQSLGSPIQIAGTCTASGCPNVRVDNIGFGLTTQWKESVNQSSSDWMIRVDNAFGVLDHNTLPSGSQVELFNANLSAYLGAGAFGDNSWAQASTFSGPNQLYAENNIVFSNQAMSDCDTAPTGGAVGGCRVEGRFNQFTFVGAFAFMIPHGLDTDGRPQGGRQISAYGNTINCPAASNVTCVGIVGYRSGTGNVFGNTVVNAPSGSNGFFKRATTLDIYREAYKADQWGACGGSSPYDTNAGGTVTLPSTLTGTGSGTVTDTSQTWTVNQFAPGAKQYVLFDRNGNSNKGQWAAILSNTATTLTLAVPSAGFTPAIGDSYVIVGSTKFYSGTATSGTSGLTLQDTLQSFGNLIPLGAPYSVYNITQGFWSAVTSNTATTVTVQSANHGGFSAFASGDSYAVLQATACGNQGGRGIGNSVSGFLPSPVDALSEALDPIYEWDNSVSVGGFNAGGNMGSSSLRTITYRDWYTDNSNGVPQVQTSPTAPFSCNGTTGGVGFGLLANRPSSCSGACATNSPGCGYFATNQGSWNASGNGFGQGILYKWIGGAWVSSFTPYSYPHPLTVVASPAAIPTFSPGTGTYTSIQSVTISTASAGAIICYSTTSNALATNGVAGCTMGTLYTGPVSVSSTEALYAVAGGTGFTDSAVGSATYVFGPSMTNAVIFAGVVPTHGLCKASPSVTELCLAADCNCWWVSVGGAAYVPFGVSSVNGKSGAVVLSLQ